jgi:hypothetical protein
MSDFVARLGAELEELGRIAASPTAPSASQAPATAPPLGTHSVLKYAVVEGAERYRRIMRVLYLEHRTFGLRLTPGEVGEKLLELFDLQLDGDVMTQCLDQLHTWGALSREYDTSLARTARELRQNRHTYDITQAAVRVEGLLEALDQLAETVGALEGSRLSEPRRSPSTGARRASLEQTTGIDPSGWAARPAVSIRTSFVRWTKLSPSSSGSEADRRRTPCSSHAAGTTVVSRRPGQGSCGWAHAARCASIRP